MVRELDKNEMPIKGVVFYDILGAEVSTQNPINRAMVTFIDRSG